MISLETYKSIVADRPKKATGPEVGFRPDNDEGFPCASCIHWFYSPMMSHSVCEIMRPKTQNEQVPANWTCVFHTSDGDNFPKLEKK